MDKEAFLKHLKLLRALKNAHKARGAFTGMPRKAPEWFKKGLKSEVNHDRAWRSYRAQSMRAGDESLLMWPLRAAASKVLPKRYTAKSKSFMWDYLGAPALRADMAIGKALEKTPVVGKRLFRVKDEVPWGKGLKREVERSSALAPLVKARDIAEPILVGVGLEKGIKKLEDSRQGHDMQDQQLRTKVASVMLHLHEKNKEHEKRAHALKLLYKQAELGIAELPSTFSELETKLASLANEDLVVLEKALELSGGNMKLGELGRKDLGSAISPAEKFQASILGDEL